MQNESKIFKGGTLRLMKAWRSTINRSKLNAKAQAYGVASAIGLPALKIVFTSDGSVY
jgi:hypothetical protein